MIMNSVTINTKFGIIELTENNQKLISLKLLSDKNPLTFDLKKANLKNQTNEFLLSVERQLNEYFSKKRKVFDLDLNPKGTEFQQKAWQILSKINYAETISYEEQAILIGNKNSKRAVGQANSKNPIPIIIPCHRVVRKNKALGGYAGGIDMKKLLLELESK